MHDFVAHATNFVAHATDFVACATDFVACATDFVACGMLITTPVVSCSVPCKKQNLFW